MDVALPNWGTGEDEFPSLTNAGLYAMNTLGNGLSTPSSRRSRRLLPSSCPNVRVLIMYPRSRQLSLQCAF